MNASAAMSFAASGQPRRAAALSRTSCANWPGSSRREWELRAACASVTTGSFSRSMASVEMLLNSALTR